MSKGEVSTVLVLIAYVAFFGVVITSVIEAFGANSIITYLTVVGLVVGLILLATHKGLNKSIEKMDE